MRLTPHLALAALTVAAAMPSEIEGQASAYVPVDDWAMPVVEHLIRTRVIADPAPLSRPLTRAAIVRALRQADTTRAAPAVRATIRQLLDRLAPADTAPTFRADLFLGAAAATHDRRNLLRESGDDWIAAVGGARLTATFGALALSTTPYFDTHLPDDPDWTGDTTDLEIPGRLTDAYVSLETRYADLFLGSLARNWGTPQEDGLVVSSNPHTYDHIALRLGTDDVRIETMLTQLDDYLAPSGAVINRFFVAHRATFRPIRALTFAVGSSTLWRGEGRTWELRWLNPLKLPRQTAIDESLPDSNNSAVFAELRAELPRGVVFTGQALIDDMHTGSQPSLPDRLGGSAVLDAVLRPDFAVRASFTAVSSLTYRSRQGPDFTVALRGVGLGDDFTGYTRATLSGSWMPAPSTLLQPEITWLRQGESDLRDPIPPGADASHPFLFVGTVEDTWRLALDGRWRTIDGVIETSTNAGIHFVDDAGHVAGQSRTTFVGRVGVTWWFGGRIGR